MKKTIILATLLIAQYGKAQNISVSVSSNIVVLTMSGPTNVSDLSASLNNTNDTLVLRSAIIGTLSLSGSPSGISVNNGTKETTISLITFSSFSGINLQGSSGIDTVSIGSGGIDLSNAAGGTNQSIAIELSTGSDVVNVSNPLKSKGSGEISINVSKSIIITADMITQAGGIYLTANLQPTPTSGNFAGVDISADLITDVSIGGEVYIESKGGNTGNGNYGVYLHGGNTIKPGGSASASIVGTGGASTGNNNYGVYIKDNNSIISATGGAVSIAGDGGGSGSSSANNFGVVIGPGALVTNDGSGFGAVVNISGYGGGGINDSQTGIDIQGKVSSTDGDIYVEGLGGSSAGSFTSNIGILLRGGGLVEAHGYGAASLVGTATAVQAGSDGIQMRDSANISTDSGSISITGISHSNNFGVAFTGDNAITSGNNQSLSILANKASLGTLSAGTGTLALFPASGNDIDLGGDDDVAVLGLTSAELDQFSCGKLIVGDTNFVNAIVVSDTINPAQVEDEIELNTSGLIQFSSGILEMDARTLQVHCSSMGFTGGKLDLSDSASLLVFTNSAPLQLPQGLFNGPVQDLSVNGSGGIILGDTLKVNGKLSLNNGSLSIGSKVLELNGTIDAMSAVNALKGSSASKLSIGGSDTASMGTLYFASGADTLHSLVINRSGATGTNAVVKLGTNISVTNTLSLTEGKMDIDDYTFSFTGNTINGGDSTSYIQITGAGGFKRPGGSAILFPVGYNPYLPVTLNCSSCGGTDFTVQVGSGVTDETNTPITSDVVNATWSVLSSSNQTADISLQWPVSAEVSMPHTNLTLGTRTSTLNPWSRVGFNLAVSGTNPYSVSFSGVSFSSGVTSMFGVGGAPTPLPVAIMHMQADCRQLTWQTGHEEINTTYTVMGSKDGKTWSAIGEVKGNSAQSGSNTYIFQLPSASVDHTYFRLAVENETGKMMSPIAVADCHTDKTYNLYPNPVSDVLNINGVEEGTSVVVYSTMGRVVYEAACNSDKMQVPVQELAAGLYIVHIGDRIFHFNKVN